MKVLFLPVLIMAPLHHLSYLIVSLFSVWQGDGLPILARMWAMLVMLSMPCSIFLVMFGSGVGSVTVAKMVRVLRRGKKKEKKKLRQGFLIISKSELIIPGFKTMNSKMNF